MRRRLAGALMIATAIAAILSPLGPAGAGARIGLVAPSSAAVPHGSASARDDGGGRRWC